MDEKMMESLRKKVKKIYPNASDKQIDDIIKVRQIFWKTMID